MESATTAMATVLNIENGDSSTDPFAKHGHQGLPVERFHKVPAMDDCYGVRHPRAAIFPKIYDLLWVRSVVDAFGDLGATAPRVPFCKAIKPSDQLVIVCWIQQIVTLVLKLFASVRLQNRVRILTCHVFELWDRFQLQRRHKSSYHASSNRNPE